MKVLIVDDNPVNRKLLRVILMADGHSIVEASDGTEALKALRGQAFDAVVSDVLMPGMDGYRLCYEVRRDNSIKQVPIIVYTSTYTSASDESLAIKVGADRFIRKPAPAEVLLGALREIVAAPVRRETVAPATDETAILKEYSVALVRKLEEKNAELETAQAGLKSTIRELQGSESRIRELIDTAPIGIYQASPDGRVLAANAALATMLGYDSPRELLALDIARDIYADPGDRAEVLDQFPEGLRGVELRWKKRGGQLLWVEIDGQVVADESGAPRRFEAFVRDVTARKLAEESIQRLTSAVKQSINVIFMTDTDGKITYVNPAFEATYGYSKDEALGKNPRFLKSGLLDKTTYEIFWSAVLSGEGFRGEMINRAKDGTVVTVEAAANSLFDSDGKRIGFVAVQNDISGRKRAEEALRESEVRFRSAFEMSPVGMALVAPNGKWLQVNRRLCDITGYAEQELLALTFQDITHPDDLDADQSLTRQVLAGEISFYQLEKRYIHKTGRVVWINLSVSLVRDTRGNPLHFVSQIEDISDRRAMENAVEESERRFRSLIENASDIIAVIDPDGTIQYTSPSTRRILGYDPKSLVGKTFMTLIHPDDQAMAAGKFANTLRFPEKPDDGEFRCQRKDGGSRLLQTRSTVVQESSGSRSVILNARDITEQRAAEEATRESERRYRSLFESNPLPMWVFDSRSLRFEDVNAAAISHYGYSREEFLSMTIRDVRPAEDLPLLENSLPSQMNEVRNVGVWRHRKKDGSVIDVEVTAIEIEAQGRPHRLAILNDITERRRSEVALENSEKRLRHVVSSSPAVTYALRPGESGDMPVVWLSENVEQLLGYTQAECLVPGWWREHLHPDERTAMIAAESELFRRRHVVMEYRFQKSDGSYRWMRDEQRLFLGEDGGAAEIMGTWSDVSERKLLEEQFLHSQKMEAVGRLAGGIAHDFNNLLMVIGASGELVELHQGRPEKVKGYLEELQKATARGAALTQQLLAFSRKQVVAPVVFDPGEVVAEMQSMLTRLLGEDIDLTCSAAQGGGNIRMDRGQFEQIIMNLVVNARDAMPAGGRLSIAVEPITRDSGYTAVHAESRPGPFIRVTVQDSGSGMDEEVKRHIFEPFFTTKEQGKGTGLGLATVYGIVKGAGGDIWVYSEPEIGTAFKVYLPRVNAIENPAEAASPPEASLATRSHATILLVEDEETIRNMAREYLESAGYRVLCAGNGAEAVNMAAAEAAPVDLLVTDVVVPGRNGREVAAELRRRQASLPVIFMSGYTDDAELVRGVMDEGMVFLQKPFGMEVLARKIREVLSKPGTSRIQNTDPEAG